MPFYKSPEGKIIEAGERWDEQTGVDINRSKLANKGFTPLQKLYAPDNSRAILVDHVDTNAEKRKRLQEKGWQTDVEREAKQAAAKGTEATRTEMGTITSQELEAIAKKNGVPFEFLDNAVEMVGAIPEYREQNKIKGALHTIGRSVGGGIPEFLYREAQNDPRLEQAFSDLQQLADRRRSTLAKGAEIVGGLAVPGGAAVKAGTRTLVTAKGLATGTAVGATYGAAGSEEGKEWQSALLGAAIGGVLGGTAALFDKGAVNPELIKETVEGAAKNAGGKNIETLIQQTRTKEASTIQAREAAVVNQQVSEEGLEALGTWVSKRKSTAELLQKQKIDPNNPEVLKELGSVDLDYQNLKVAEELGFQGKVPSRTRMVQNKEKFAKQVSQAKQFLAEKRAIPGGQQEIEQAFRRVTDKAIVKKLAQSTFKNDKEERFVALRQFFEAPVDGKYVMRGIDRRLGTNGERVIMDMDKATNQLTYILASANKELDNLSKAAKSAGLDVTKFRSYVEDSTIFNQLDDAQKKVVGDVKDFFEKHRVAVSEGYNFPIKKRENYFPHRSPSLLETISRVRQRAIELKEKTGIDLLSKKGKTAEAFQDVTEEEFRLILNTDPDLVQALGIMGRTQIKDAPSFSREFFSAITPGAGKRPMQATEASAAFLREDKLPAFLLQDDLINGGLGWVQETYRHVLIKDQLAELQRLRDIADGLKDIRAKEYLDNLLDDLTGLRVGTLASETTKLKLAFRTKMDEILATGNVKSGAVRSTLRFMRDAPEAFPTMLSTAYPNFLGLSPRAVLMNLSQIPMMTVPELGSGLGTRAGFRALFSFAQVKAKGREILVSNPVVADALKVPIGSRAVTKDINLILQNEGFVSKQYTQELVDALRNDMKVSLPIETYKKAVNAYSNVAMSMFNASEVINRGLVSEMGRHVTMELMEGTGDALKWLSRTPVSNQKLVAELVQAGDTERLTKHVQEYLLSKTILNYTRQSMSAYGRFMGPMFSMFTKWPSTMYGEIIEAYSARGFGPGTREIGRRFMAPLAGIYVVGKMAEAIAEDEGLENQLKYLTGSRGVAAWAPITSVEALAGGEFLKSPAADVAGNIGSLLTSPSWKQLEKSLNELTSTFVPGMSVIRVLQQDVPRMQGEDGKFRPIDFEEGE